mmetsp:Transcript_10934/g.15763  ORF Transcript_10934/g.15763 Transcript_10934/m.15763 type:complete len:330 (-) Transcript_10934:1007-1996(-)
METCRARTVVDDLAEALSLTTSEPSSDPFDQAALESAALASVRIAVPRALRTLQGAWNCACTRADFVLDQVPASKIISATISRALASVLAVQYPRRTLTSQWMLTFTIKLSHRFRERHEHSSQIPVVTTVIGIILYCPGISSTVVKGRVALVVTLIIDCKSRFTVADPYVQFKQYPFNRSIDTNHYGATCLTRISLGYTPWATQWVRDILARRCTSAISRVWSIGPVRERQYDLEAQGLPPHSYRPVPLSSCRLRFHWQVQPSPPCTSTQLTPHTNIHQWSSRVLVSLSRTPHMYFLGTALRSLAVQLARKSRKYTVQAPRTVGIHNRQ